MPLPTTLLALLLAGPALSGPGPEGRAAITAAELARHVETLAGDAMEGREVGTPGELRAAKYLAEQLALAGAEPAGDDDTFLQRVPLSRPVVTAGPELRARTDDAEADAAVYGRDYEVVVLGAASGQLRVSVATDEDEMPEPDAAVAVLLDASWSRARRWLDAAGAPGGAGYGAVLLRGSDEPRDPRPFRTAGRLQLASEAEAPAVPWLRVHGELLGALRSGEVETVALTLEASREEVDAFNVVGILPGRGAPGRPELGEQAVVLSAHYDHLGVLEDAPDGQDAVFNGADDDASGCAAVLELAGAWDGRPAPARSIVLLLATGEERGLLGTRYYLEHPVVPLADTVANVNFEMVGRPDGTFGGPGVLWLTGFERSNLGPAADALGLAVVPDQRPDQRFFQRSDNYAFAVRGVVAQTLSSYGLHRDYHTVRDEAELLDYEHMQAAVESAHALVEAIATGELHPAWAPDGAPGPR